MGKETVLMWSYLRQSVTEITDFAHLEVFCGGLSSFMFKIQKLKNISYDVNALPLY